MQLYHFEADKTFLLILSTKASGEKAVGNLTSLKKDYFAFPLKLWI